jgi:membrane-bound lytic murein transglycosylase A
MSKTMAPKASSSNKYILRFPQVVKIVLIIASTWWLASCGVAPTRPDVPVAPEALAAPLPAAVDDLLSAELSRELSHYDNAPLPAPRVTAKSRWVPVRWAELPGLGQDPLFEAWNAWIKSCERPGPVFAPLCSQVRRLSIATPEAQRAWLLTRLQPYRIESLAGPETGQLTSYFEPLIKASRERAPGFEVPLYRAPAGLAARKPWYTRQEIETLPEARAALLGREIAWLADPIDALMLHIQGSGRISITAADGTERVTRLAFAGSNEQPYRSVNQWLISQGVTRVNPWPDATKAWAAQNPQRVSQLLWSNPRYIFFQEEALTPLDSAFGPRGAQGVALTPGRSIAVDPSSIPYGTPVWLASRGPAANLQRLVFAQDTGSAIVGAVRADYFAGTGDQAGLFAARMNQPLQLWALWPK